MELSKDKKPKWKGLFRSEFINVPQFMKSLLTTAVSIYGGRRTRKHKKSKTQKGGRKHKKSRKH
jgi:hypothetical protein